MRKVIVCTAVAVMVGFFGGTAGAQEAPAATCKQVHADLVEAQSTTSCKPGHPVCFLGEVDGNHGLRGTTYFRGEQGALFPPGAPTFRSYVGSFEYTTATGTLAMREMGLTEPPNASNPESGVVNAFQRIVVRDGRVRRRRGLLVRERVQPEPARRDHRPWRDLRAEATSMIAQRPAARTR